MNETTSIPAHVPPELVFDFDFISDARLKPDLQAGLRSLHGAAPPIFFTPRNGGHWIVIGYEQAFDVAREHSIFRNSGQSIQKDADDVALLPMSIDPPDHELYRKPMMQLLSPKAIAHREQSIATLARQLIDDVADQGRCDFLTSIGEPLPVTVLMELVGIPTERLVEFRQWSVRAIATPDAQERADIMRNVVIEMTKVIQQRMEKREDDLISQLLDSKIGERPPTLDEMQRYCTFLFLAGLDSVTNAVSFAHLHLARDQELQTRLRNDESLIPDTVEELLRMYSVSTSVRRVGRDATFLGVFFKEDDRVLMHLPAANHDPQVYAQSAQFELNRPKPHIAFMPGIHRCLGSHLARMEMQISMREFLRHIPQFRLDPNDPPRFHAGMVMSVDSLPLIW